MSVLAMRPFLTAAALEIAYDNGMIFRDHNERTFLAEAEVALIAEDEISDTDLTVTEEYLSTLSHDALVELCGGEHVEPVTELEQIVDKVLNRIFES